jgi:hypothetical protein
MAFPHKVQIENHHHVKHLIDENENEKTLLAEAE